MRWYTGEDIMFPVEADQFEEIRLDQQFKLNFEWKTSGV